ncbi:hypothetical protein L1049_004015 [Liquidambar formosana]|uniref:FLZ-type domain-containing protein n=1 Tax=Liquidambar formosana TaxID=63359 RepID=A0AAP0WVP3_LIQFO
MLRNRSRAVTSKQAIMADHSSLTSPNQDHTRPTSNPFFGSPKLFRGLITKGETKAVMSPTSMLDTTPFFAVKNPFCHDKNMPKSPKTGSENTHTWDKLDSRGIGLALIGSTVDENGAKENSSKPGSRMVIFGSQLKVQIPPLPPSAISPTGSPKSPADFGIKTRISQLGSLSSFGSPNSGIQTKDSPRVFTGCLPVSEMELSEDYTRVISHGPNPRTIHIFDNCIVESCRGVVGSPALRTKKEYRRSFSDMSSPASESFLSFCYTCKKNLGQKKDIFIYRGEKAFCSPECRSQEMLLDGSGEFKSG